MTAISAAVTHAAGAVPPRVTVSVTGAPNPPAASYTANFSATVDGFTYGGVAGGSLSWSPTYQAMIVNSPVDNVFGEYYAERTVTGLSVGVSYTFSANVAQGGAGTRTKEQAKLTVRTTGGTQIANTTYMLPTSVTAGVSTIAVQFTATATSHVIRVYTTASPPAYTGGTNLALYVRAASVTPAAWLGTRVYRTDDNGADQVVRLAPGQDVVAGSMTVADWEPALTGTVTYRVVDGAGGMATAAGVTFEPSPGAEAADGLWLTKPETAVPNAGAGGAPTSSRGLSVIAYRARRVNTGQLQQVIDRPDKVGNPGVMTLRSGSLTILCEDHDQARAIGALLDAGTPVRLIQPNYPAVDMLFIGTASDAEMIPGIDKWTLGIDYEEQLGEALQ